MNITYKKRLGAIAAASVAAHLAVYLLFHLPTLVIYVESDFWYDAFYYAHDLLYKLISVILPVLCASAALSLCPEGGVKRPLLYCGLLSLTKLIYIFPYTYNFALLSYGYDSVSGLLIALGVSVGYTLLGTGYSYLLYLLMLKVGRHLIAKASYAELPAKYVSAPTDKMRADALSNARNGFAASVGLGGIFDLSAPYTAAVFAAAFVQFCLRLAVELWDVVTYLVEYAGSYRTGEVIYILAVLLLLFLSVFVTHLTCILTGRLLAKKELSDND